MTGMRVLHCVHHHLSCLTQVINKRDTNQYNDIAQLMSQFVSIFLHSILNTSHLLTTSMQTPGKNQLQNKYNITQFIYPIM